MTKIEKQKQNHTKPEKRYNTYKKRKENNKKTRTLQNTRDNNVKQQKTIENNGK